MNRIAFKIKKYKIYHIFFILTNNDRLIFMNDQIILNKIKFNKRIN